MPDGELLGVAVAEHDRELGVGGTYFLDVQGDPVVGVDHPRPVGSQREEQLVTVGVRGQPRPTDGVALRGQAGRGADRHKSGEAADEPRGPGPAHAPVPTYARGTREPTRVTIS